jgi:uncharacterized protein (UPF0333 family)
MFAQKLRGFEDCNASTIYRYFVKGKGTVFVDGNKINVVYPRRAHNPILRSVPWDNIPSTVPAYNHAKVDFSFM